MADQKGNLSWNRIFGTERISPSLRYTFIHQLEKDLQHSFSDTDPETIFSELLEVVELSSTNDLLPALLYRVDVSEQKARNCMATTDPVQCLAYTILKREAQKVIFRSQYSGR